MYSTSSKATSRYWRYKWIFEFRLSEVEMSTNSAFTCPTPAGRVGSKPQIFWQRIENLARENDGRGRCGAGKGLTPAVGGLENVSLSLRYKVFRSRLFGWREGSRAWKTLYIYKRVSREIKRDIFPAPVCPPSYRTSCSLCASFEPPLPHLVNLES